jgi:hypothetical protein
MNFFGHAVVAAAISPQPEVALGAMVPDFFAMTGRPCTASADGALGRGIALHHATDHHFHGHVIFTDLQRRSFAFLEARGVDRGPARAVAHFGVELLLDVGLAAEPDARSGYLGALAASPLDVVLVGCTDSERSNVEAVRLRLLAFGVDLHEAADTLLAERIIRVLARRPRLALAHNDAMPLAEWVAEFRAEAASVGTALVADLAAALTN